MVCLLLLTGCGNSSSAMSDTPPANPAPLAVPLAKPHQKLGVEMHHLNQQRDRSLVKQARQRELLVKDGLLVVQLAYEGAEDSVLQALQELQIPVLSTFPKFQRLDAGLRSYSDLDAVIGIGHVYRIEALTTPMSRAGE